jgi:hypothetical protein
LDQNIDNEAYDSGPDELQDQIDEFFALSVDINAEIHQEDLVEEEEVGELVNGLINVGIEENLLNLQIDPAQIPANISTHINIVALDNDDYRINGRIYVRG